MLVLFNGSLFFCAEERVQYSQKVPDPPLINCTFFLGRYPDDVCRHGWGRGYLKADHSTDRLCDFDSDKGEKGSKYLQMLRTSFKYRPLVDPAVICGIKWLTNCKHVGVIGIGCIAWRDGLS